MRRLAAAAILGVAYGAGCCAIGAQVRGDVRGEELTRDMLTGLAITAAAAAVAWAANEFGGENE